VKYSFCESSNATATSPWHIRELTRVGPKPCGGIDTVSLCGRVNPPYGWDLPVKFIEKEPRTCAKCASVYFSRHAERQT
jgi:hypothetical protein